MSEARCEMTGLPEANCGHCADFHDYLRRESLPPDPATAAAMLVGEALFLRMYGERPPGAPHDDIRKETWAEWDRRAEGFLRARPVGKTVFGSPGDSDIQPDPCIDAIAAEHDQEFEPELAERAPPSAMCECSHHWRVHAESGDTSASAVCHGFIGSATPGPLREPCRCLRFAPWRGPIDARTGEPVRPLTMVIDARTEPPRSAMPSSTSPALPGAQGGER